MPDLSFSRVSTPKVNNDDAMLARVKQEGRKVLEEDLPNDKLWVKASRNVYKLMNGTDFQGDDHAAAKAGIDMISEFNYNVGLGMIPQTIKLEDATPDEKASMLYLMDTYDKKDATFAGFTRMVTNVVSDPASYIGIGTFGVGLAAREGTKQVAKQTVRKSIADSLGTYFKNTSAVAATEGAMYGAGTNLANQNVKVKGGAQKEISTKEALTSAGIGGAIGAVAPTVIKEVGKATSNIVGYLEKQGEQAMAQAAGGGTPKLDPDFAKFAGDALQGLSKTTPKFHPSKAVKQLSDMEKEYYNKEALGIESSDLDHFDTKHKYQVNFSTIQSPEDIASTIAYMAEQNAEAIQKARGYKSDDMVRKMADELGENPEKLIKAFTREDGFLPPAEYIVAARKFMEQSAIELLNSARRIANGDDSTPAMTEFAMKHHLHNDFMNYFMGVRAEIGRTQRAMGIKFDVTETDKINELMGRIGAGLDLKEMAKQIASLDSVKGINNQAKKQKSIGKYTRDRFFTYYVNSLLSGLGTHFYNTIGTALNLGMSVADRALAARLGSKLESEAERIQKGEASAMAYAMLSSFRDAQRIAWNVMKTGDQYLGTSQIEVAESLDEPLSVRMGFTKDSFLQKTADGVDAILQAPIKNLMGGTDAFFKVLAERASIAASAYRRATIEAAQYGEEAGQRLLTELTTNPTPELLKEAEDFAQWVTFQESLGETGQKVQAALGIEGIRWFTPFVKSPTNILKQGYLERSPFALLATKYRADLSAGGAREQLAKAKLYNGSMLLATAVSLALAGKLTGTADKDARYKGDAIAKKQQRSFVFKDEDGTEHYVSFDRLEPFSFLFGVAADLAKFYKDSEYTKITDEDQDKASRMRDSAILALAENTTNKLYFQGAIKMMDLLTADTKGEALGRVLESLSNGIMPFSGLRRNLSYLTDDSLRATNGMWDFIRANTPFLSRKLEPKLDIFGDEIDRRNPIGLIPQKGTDDSVKKEIERITDSIRQAPIPPVSDRVNGTRLNIEEHTNLTRFSRKELRMDGMTFYEQVHALINSGEYDKMIDEDKVLALRSLAHDYDNEAKELTAMRDPSFREKMDRVPNLKEQKRLEQMFQTQPQSEE